MSEGNETADAAIPKDSEAEEVKAEETAEREKMEESETVEAPPEEAKAEEMKVEETKTEETKVEETKPEETEAEEIKTEETKTEETKVEETKTEETKVEETKTEETKAEETKAEETKVEETITEETKAEETITEETKAEETITEETKVEETKTEEMELEETKLEEAKEEETKTEEAKTEETKTEEAKSEETKTEEMEVEGTKTEEAKPEETKTDEAETEETKTDEAKKDDTAETDKMEVETPTEDDSGAVEEIKGRLKFFFSDANVRQDHFIRKLLMKEDGDSPHRVPIGSLLRFNTIKSITTNPAVVVKATKELSEFLTLDEDEKNIGRVKPFTEDMMDENIPLSLHIKNLPLKNGDNEKSPKQYAVTMDEIRDAFSKYAEVVLVKLKWSAGGGGHHGKKKRFPVRAALVEFASEEGMQKAAEATLTFKDGEKVEPKDKIKFGDDDLEIMKLSEYVEKKKKEKNDESKGNGKVEEGATNGEDSKKRTHEETETSDVPAFTFDWQPGCVIKMKGLPGDCDREAILDMLATALETTVEGVKKRKVYADFSRGQEDGAIRFPEFADDIAGVAKRLKDGELQIKGEKITDAFILEGEDEKKYWDEFIAFKNRQQQQTAEEKRSKKARPGRGGRRG